MFRTIQLIRPRPSELEGDIAGADQVQSVAGQRRAKDVAADALEAVALPGRNPHARMEIEVLPTRVTRRRRRRRRGAGLPQALRAPPLASRRRQPLYGGRGPPGEERLGLRERIGHIVALDALSTEQPVHRGHEAGQDFRHVCL